MKKILFLLLIIFQVIGLAHAQYSWNLQEMTPRLIPWERMASFEILPISPVNHRYSNTYSAGASINNTAVAHFPYVEYGKNPITNFPPILINKGLLETAPRETCNYFVKANYDLGSGFLEKTIPVLHWHATTLSSRLVNNFFDFELLDSKGRSLRFRISMAEQRHTNGQISITAFSLSFRSYLANKVNTSVFNNPNNPVPSYRLPFEVFKSIQFLKSCR